ncbi:DUF389 domain-containing protein [Falsiroseomonas sp.]|uniref:DUF389 domain-containing protein n=1 Tax=Falsiroseomonas sp. TaxID=2870721 RepID=UPI003569F589
MSRKIELSLAPELRVRIMQRLQEMPGVASVTLQVGASVSPPGDVVSIDATNEAALAILGMLDEAGVFEEGSVTLGEPTAIIAPRHLQELDRQGNEAAWEEMGEQLRRDTNVTRNFLLLMGTSGAVAAFGLVSDTLHIVLGAMLIAPGFEPLLRVLFGIMGHRHAAGAGLRSSLAGYLAMAAGAAAALPLALLLQGRAAADLPGLHWAGYWSSVQASGIAVSLVAGVAGATIVSARLTVFATGVMVALALVPSMALVGVGLASGNPGLALGGLLRWGVEVLCVLLAGGTVLALKRRFLHHRRVFD